MSIKKGYSVPISPNLGKRHKIFKEIEYVSKLGKFDDDRKIHELKALIRGGAGWVYDFGIKVNSTAFDSKNKKQYQRNIREGDFYVKFKDGTFCIYDAQCLAFHRKMWKKQNPEAETPATDTSTTAYKEGFDTDTVSWLMARQLVDSERRDEDVSI